MIIDLHTLLYQTTHSFSTEHLKFENDQIDSKQNNQSNEYFKTIVCKNICEISKINCVYQNPDLLLYKKGKN